MLWIVAFLILASVVQQSEQSDDSCHFQLFHLKNGDVYFISAETMNSISDAYIYCTERGANLTIVEQTDQLAEIITSLEEVQPEYQNVIINAVEVISQDGQFWAHFVPKSVDERMFSHISPLPESIREEANIGTRVAVIQEGQTTLIAQDLQQFPSHVLCQVKHN